VLTNKQTNWQTNRRCWKHPPRSAMLRLWVKTPHNSTDLNLVDYHICAVYSRSAGTMD